MLKTCLMIPGQIIKEINAHVDQLKTWATELDGLRKKYEEDKTSNEEKKKLMKSMRSKISRMSTTYVDTRSMICKFVKSVYLCLCIFTFFIHHQLNSK